MLYCVRYFLPPTRIWFFGLRSSSVSKFEDLSHAFSAHFVGKRRRVKVSNHLFSIVQKLKELLRSYVQRFNAALTDIPKPKEGITLAAF